VAILDQSVNRAGEQVDGGQQADRALALIFMIAREGRGRAGFERQIRGGRGDRLDASQDGGSSVRLRQVAAVRKELDQEYEASITPLAKASQPPVSSKSVP
jgi:hypothetical protein